MFSDSLSLLDELCTVLSFPVVSLAMFDINLTQLLEYSDTDEEATSLAGDADPDYSLSSAPSVSSFPSLSEEEQESGEGLQDGEEQEVDELLEERQKLQLLEMQLM